MFANGIKLIGLFSIKTSWTYNQTGKTSDFSSYVWSSELSQMPWEPYDDMKKILAGDNLD